MRGFILGLLSSVCLLTPNAMAQTLVQLDAPAEMRGRAIGVFSMFAMGMRMFSGITVGLVGARIGIHWSLALSAATLFVVIGTLIRFGLRKPASANA